MYNRWPYYEDKFFKQKFGRFMKSFGMSGVDALGPFTRGLFSKSLSKLVYKFFFIFHSGMKIVPERITIHRVCMSHILISEELRRFSRNSV
jgi:hypothetical protein